MAKHANAFDGDPSLGNLATDILDQTDTATRPNHKQPNEENIFVGLIPSEPSSSVSVCKSPATGAT